MSPNEATTFTAILRKLNRLAGMTRPEISLFVCKTSKRGNDSTISDLISAKNILKFMQGTPTYIHTKILDLESLNIKAFVLVSCNNLYLKEHEKCFGYNPSD